MISLDIKASQDLYDIAALEGDVKVKLKTH
jgi:hypothetical protein